MKLNEKQVFATNEVFKRLNCLRRWTSCANENKYNELSKQALNNIILYLLASFSEEAGNIVKWERFPQIALYRAYQKVYVVFDIPQANFDKVFEIGNIPKDALNNATNDVIKEKTDSEFMKFISQGLGTNEMRLYKAATKIATNIELMELSYKMNPHDYRQKSIEISDSLKEFEDLPGIQHFINVDGEIFKCLLKIASLRNLNRWAVQCYCMDCSVLGHLFDTAIFAYFMALEKDPEDEVTATQNFYTGLFHDIPETWTGDFPSPIKDRIIGFRLATEEFEQLMLQEEFYNKLPSFLRPRLQSIEMDKPENLKDRPLFKGADYLSAASECFRQYKAGSRDEYFFETPLKNDRRRIENGEIEMTPICKKLFYMIYNYAESLNL